MTQSTYDLLSNPDDPRHGTASAYIYHGCRCDPCKAANTERQQANRERRRSRPVPDHVHGTRNGYDNYLCDCDPCRAANAAKGK